MRIELLDSDVFEANPGLTVAVKLQRQVSAKTDLVLTMIPVVKNTPAVKVGHQVAVD